MTEEQFKRAVEISNRLKGLEEVKSEINNKQSCRLSYIYDSTLCDIRECTTYSMNVISELLVKHDQMICEEIDEEIRKLQEEIKEL